MSSNDFNLIARNNKKHEKKTRPSENDKFDRNLRRATKVKLNARHFEDDEEDERHYR